MPEVAAPPPAAAEIGAADLSRRWRCGDLVVIFARLFAASHNTRLEGGGEEPVYVPAAAAGDCCRIIFTRDYFASALHEVAHWCIAGPARRLRQDYGYWYRPDGRSAAEQRRFEQVEIKPQALEWIFSSAAGYRFRVSADNLGAANRVEPQFGAAIYRQVLRYCEQGLPPRAESFARALAARYGCADPLNPRCYDQASLSQA